MPFSFIELVGEIIRTCGTLETLINVFIHRLGNDKILAEEIVRLPFTRRVQVLRQLMLERTSLTKKEVKNLCDELAHIGNERNKIAHSPIGVANGVAHILIIRDFFGEKSGRDKELSQQDLERIYERAQNIYQELKTIAIKTGVVPVKDN